MYPLQYGIMIRIQTKYQDRRLQMSYLKRDTLKQGQRI